MDVVSWYAAMIISNGGNSNSGETRALLGQRRGSTESIWHRWLMMLVVVGGIAVFGTGKIRREYPSEVLDPLGAAKPEEGIEFTPSKLLLFPPDFVWGVATSAYQIEGGVNDGGRGATVWDTFVAAPGTILDHSTGAIADDHYHRWREDVKLMKEELGVTAYRFSIAWSRIFPKGRGSKVNLAGIKFYESLIDELLANDIEPWITLFHWDLPQSLQDEYEGFLDVKIVDDFVEYARAIFDAFGSKVTHFITLNEPWTYSVNGHSTGIHAPGRKQRPDIEPYIVAHNLLLAHARTVAMYKKDFGNGLIGISNCGDFRYPLNKDESAAAERAMLFQWGWFVDPLVFGDYPQVMRKLLGDRLPTFTSEESAALQGSFDFLGLNYYSAFFAATPEGNATYAGYWADIHVEFSDDPSWEHNDMGWNIVPDGLREMMLWIQDRYKDPLLFITENGSSFYEPNDAIAIHDVKRQSFIEKHLMAANEAIRSHNVRLSGYFAWSLMDNFEWQFGYQRRFGIVRVDYESLRRTLKRSAMLYRDIIRYNQRKRRASSE